jgi:transposase
MVSRPQRLDNAKLKVPFAPAPWDESTPAWQEIDRRIPPQHLARQIDAAVDGLNLEELFASYQGRGTQPHPPALLLKMVLYEMRQGKPSPAEWFRDSRESDSLKWLGRGLQPSRTCLYDFRDRLGPLLDGLNAQILQSAIQQGHAPARRAAIDGTTVAAAASRHKLVKSRTLQNRIEQLDQAIDADQTDADQTVADQAVAAAAQKAPAWMANQPATRQQQRERYGRALRRLEQLQRQNAQRRACKRQDPEKIVVSLSDPESACGRDKQKVFRPLYTVPLLLDLDSPFILGYEVFAQATDSGTLEPMLERTTQLSGRKPETLLGDATFAALSDLEACERRSVLLYTPVGENDYTQKRQKQPATNQFTQLPKSEFTWLPEAGTYRCPQGHRLAFEARYQRPRAGDAHVSSSRFRCPAEHCSACPLQSQCTTTPHRGRSVSRMDQEELIEALRKRMQTEEAKALYRLRSQTVELAYADMKTHRGLSRLRGSGLRRAKAQVGLFVLTHNLLALHKKAQGDDEAFRTTRTLEKHAA